MRSARIDFLRGLSILAVLLLHFSLTYDLVDSPLSTLTSRSLVAALVLNGNFGVTAFFVISGYLITSTNLRRYQALANVRLSEFYAIRFARIAPPLVLALAIISILRLCHTQAFTRDLHGFAASGTFFFIAIVSVLTFWHNALIEWVGYFNWYLNVYWSLSVEEVFYLTFPLLCVLLKRSWLIAVGCCAVIVVGPIYRFLHRGDELYYLYGDFACFDAIALGCLAALLHRKMTLSRGWDLLLRWVGGIGLALAYYRGVAGHQVAGFTLVALSTTALLFTSYESSSGKPQRLPTRIVCWLGDHSYEIYLFHMLVLAAMRALMPKAALPYALKLPLLLLFVLLSAACAGVVAHFYAVPLNRSLRRTLLGKSRTGPGVEPPPSSIPGAIGLKGSHDVPI